jgi:hypothetical protein
MPATRTTTLRLLTALTRAHGDTRDIKVQSMAGTKVIPVALTDDTNPDDRAVQIYCQDLAPWTYTIHPDGPGEYLVEINVPAAFTQQSAR